VFKFVKLITKFTQLNIDKKAKKAYKQRKTHAKIF